MLLLAANDASIRFHLPVANVACVLFTVLLDHRHVYSIDQVPENIMQRY